MLTSDDKNTIVRLVTGIVKVDSDALEQKLNAKIDTLPTKEDFSSRMDALSKEIQDARQELAAHSISHDRLDGKDDELDARLKLVEKRNGMTTPVVS